MLVRFIKIEEISTEKAQFYTVRLGASELTEFELFDQKSFPLHKKEHRLIYTVISEMQQRGVKSYYFKQEASAHAIPVVTSAIMHANKIDFGLRLYCKHLSNDIVILLNGDIKTHLDPLKCRLVKDHFSRALKIGSKLDKALKNNDLDLQESAPFNDFELDI